MIQKLLLSVLAVAILAGAGVLSVRHYHQYKNKQAHQAQVAQAAQVSQADQVRTAAAAEYQSLQVQYNRATSECQKGVQAYALLPAVTKAKLPAPVCPPAISK